MNKTIYNDDDTLLNEIVLLEATYSLRDGSIAKEAAIYKEAGVLGDLYDALPDFGKHIINEVKGRIEKEGPYALITFLAPAALGYLWGPLGFTAWMVTLVAQQYDISIGAIMAKAARETKAQLDSGEPMTEEDADRIAHAAIQEAGPMPVTNELFLPVRVMIKEGVFLSTAKAGLVKNGIKIPGIGGILKGILGAASFSQGKLFILALIKWTINKILMAAVMLGTAGYLTDKEPGGPTPEPQLKPRSEEARIHQPETTAPSRSVRQLPPKRPNGLSPTGRGLTRRINSHNRVWIVPLREAGAIGRTAFYWATQVYQEVNNSHRPLVMTSSAFKQMVGVLSTNYSQQTPRGLVMPSNEQLSAPIHSIKDVVDYFIWQTAPEIKGTQHEK